MIAAHPKEAPVQSAPTPRSSVRDPARLAAVNSYALAGHAHDPALDSVVRYATEILAVPMAVINLVGPDRQCYPAETGVGTSDTRIVDELSFCAYVVAERSPLVVPDARRHPVFAHNPLVVTGAVSAYLGVPLIDEDGFVLGTVSVFDSAPHEFTLADQALLQTLARLAGAALSLRRRVAARNGTRNSSPPRGPAE